MYYRQHRSLNASSLSIATESAASANNKNQTDGFIPDGSVLGFQFSATQLWVSVTITSTQMNIKDFHIKDLQ